MKGMFQEDLRVTEGKRNEVRETGMRGEDMRNEIKGGREGSKSEKIEIKTFFGRGRVEVKGDE